MPGVRSERRAQELTALFKALRDDDSAQDTAEYVLLGVLIGLAVVTLLIAFGASVNSAYSGAGSELQEHASPGAGSGGGSGGSGGSPPPPPPPPPP